MISGVFWGEMIKKENLCHNQERGTEGIQVTPSQRVDVHCGQRLALIAIMLQQ